MKKSEEIEKSALWRAVKIFTILSLVLIYSLVVWNMWLGLINCEDGLFNYCSPDLSFDGFIIGLIVMFVGVCVSILLYQAIRHIYIYIVLGSQ